MVSKPVIYISGSMTLLAALALLFALGGLKVQFEGDKTCGTYCEAYFNITSQNKICFNVTEIIETAPPIRTELYWYKTTTFKNGTRSQTISDWVKFNLKSDCISANTKTKFKLVGYKAKSQSVKWGAGMFGIDPIFNGINVTILEDGAEAARNYELGTTANITLITNGTPSASAKFCLSIGDPNYGVNYSCSVNTNFSTSYKATDISYNTFSDGTSYNNYTIGMPTKYISLTSYAQIPSTIAITLTGYLNNSDYPRNTMIQSNVNNSQPHTIYPGYLNGTNHYIDRFTNNLSKENITFLTSGAVTRYINISLNNPTLGNSNFTLQLNGYAADSTNFSYTQNFYNMSNASIFIGNSSSGSYPWDDFSAGDTLNHWATSGSNTVYGVVTSTSVNATTTDPGFTTPNFCFYALSQASTGYLYSQSLALTTTGYSQTTFGTKAIIQSYDSCCGSSVGKVEYGIKDTTVGIYTSITQYSSLSTNTYSDTVTIIKDSQYLNWYKNGILIYQLAYTASHDYEIYSYMKGWSCNHNSNINQIPVKSYFYPINATGFTNSYDGGMKFNNSNKAILISPLVFTAPKNITRAMMTTYKHNAGNGIETLYLSNNNGSNWSIVTSGNYFVFPTVNNTLKAMINITSTSTTAPFIIDNYRIDIGTGTVSNVRVDFANDKIYDFNLSGPLNESFSPQNVSVDSSLIQNYINQYCQLNLTTCAIPIGFFSDTAGILQLSGINLMQNNNATLLPNYEFTTAYTSVDNLSFIGAGVIGIGNVNERYYGDKVIQINATLNSITVSSNINWKYSPYNLTFPTGVNYWEVFPKSRTENNTQPYGQNSTVPIWTVNTTEKHIEGVDIYAKLNDTLQLTCLRSIVLNDTTTNGQPNQCYQEFANVSNCGGSALGNYSIIGFDASGYKAVNGVWYPTEGGPFATASTVDSVINITYPIPPFAYNATWLVQMGATPANISTTINTSCWNFNSSNSIRLMIHCTTTFPQHCELHCWTGANELNLSYVADAGFAGVMEEAVLWNTTSINTSTSINLTTAPQKLMTTSNGNSNNIWSYTSFDCTTNTNPFMIPYFCFQSICSTCVRTTDWNDTCSNYQ